MEERLIIQAIIDRIESAKSKDYSIWTIGLAHDTDERKQQHERDGKFTKYWKEWAADSLSKARNIESHFISQKGMQGGTGGDLSSHRTVYVYIF
jgi:hypothetical protein